MRIQKSWRSWSLRRRGTEDRGRGQRMASRTVSESGSGGEREVVATVVEEMKEVGKVEEARAP